MSYARSRHTLLLLSGFVLLGCSPEPTYNERCDWFEHGSSYYRLKPGYNFHKANVEKYPQTGFIIHSVESKAWDKSIERRAIAAAVKRCRGEFQDSFLEKSITNCSSPNGDSSDERIVNFDPENVVILIRNIHELKKFEAYEERGIPPSKIPVDELLTPYKVGYLFRSDVLFSNKTIDEIVEAGFRDENPLDLNLEAAKPKDEKVYLILDHYKSSIDSNPSP